MKRLNIIEHLDIPPPFIALNTNIKCFWPIENLISFFSNCSGLSFKGWYFLFNFFCNGLLIVHGFAIMVLARRRKKIHYKEARREANNALTGDERNILLQNNKNILREIKKHLKKKKNHERKKRKCIKIEKKIHGEANSRKVEA